MTKEIGKIDDMPEALGEQARAKAKEIAVVNDVIQALNDALVLYDADLNFVMCNDRYHEMFNSDQVPSTVWGGSLSDNMQWRKEVGYYAVPDTLTEQGFIDEMIGHITSYTKNVPVETKSGLVLSASSHKTAMQGYLIAFKDITEQHHAKIKLDTQREKTEEANTRFSEALEAMEDGISLWDSDMRFIMANRRSHELLHRGVAPYSGEYFGDFERRYLKMGVFEIPKGRNIEEMSERRVNFVRTLTKDLEFTLADDTIILASSHKTNQGGYLLTVRDITEQRRVENRLRAEEQRSQENKLIAINDVIQTLDLGLSLWDSEMNFVLNNDKYAAMFHPDNPRPKVGENLTETMQRLIEGGLISVPKDWLAKEYIDNSILIMKEYQKDVNMVMADGRVFSASIHKTALGGYLNAFTDITEQRRTEAELEHQREASHQNEKLSALGELLAGVAHELNNPLSIIAGYAQMLEGKFTDPVLNNRIDRISTAADRSTKIIKTFLAMARQRPARIEQCSLNEAVSMAVDVAGYGLRSIGTQIILELDDNLPFVSADADQLVQVFTNLIVNAEHALADQKQEGKLVLRSYYDKQTDHSVVEIRDNGPGIPTDIQARIFEPFFTTKDVGSGTGIGLAFSHRIIDTHGGQLTLKSKIDKGTSFFVKLRSLKNDTAELGSGASTSAIDQNYNILVVDDEEGVAELVRDLLQEYGNTVIVSNDARQAVQILKKDSFDVVLSDFKMPGIDGEGFFRIIQREMPHYAERIGFITGDAMSTKVKDFFNETQRPHIEKPIAVNELNALVDRLGSDHGEKSDD